jgi:hypothetical protein
MNEIFVTVGVALWLAAMSGLVALLIDDWAATTVIGAAVAWGTAVFFHEGKRFRLPLIYCCVNGATSLAFAFRNAIEGPSIFSDNASAEAILLTLGTALLGLAVSAWRFRIPFFMLPIGALFTLMITLLARKAGDDISYQFVLGGTGLLILSLAMYFDLKDPKRLLRWSDYAFWSYVIGSPLFVHSLFLGVLMEGGGNEWAVTPQLWLAWVALALIVSFAGLVLNRRALILSTLIYVGFILFRLLAITQVTTPATILLVTALLIGVYVTALGARWTHVRRYIMRHLPNWHWLRYMPPYSH